MGWGGAGGGAKSPMTYVDVLRDLSKADSVICIRRPIDVGDPGVAASAWARRDLIAEKLVVGMVGLFAGLRPHEADV